MNNEKVVNEKRAFNWSILSTYRNEIFGASIIGIIILHYVLPLAKLNLPGALEYVVQFYSDMVGATGVEVFLFLSGMGLCFSMNKDSNVLRFYKRRFTRLLIPYAIWGGLYWIVKDMILFDLGFKRVLYDFFFISFWRDGCVNLWFIGFIILMYLVYPFIYFCFRKDNKYRKLLFVLSLIFSYLVIERLQVITPNFFANTKFAFFRVPIFLFGSYYGQKIYDKEKFNFLDVMLVISGWVLNTMLVLSYRANIFTFMRRINTEYIKGIYAFGMVVVIAIVFNYAKKTIINTFLIAVGALSLELYMTHVNVRRVMILQGFRLENPLWYGVCILVAIVASILLHKICELINVLMSRRKIYRGLERGLQRELAKETDNREANAKVSNIDDDEIVIPVYRTHTYK